MAFPTRASYPKDIVFGICDVLADGESLARRAGDVALARRLAAAFDAVEAGLAG